MYPLVSVRPCSGFASVRRVFLSDGGERYRSSRRNKAPEPNHYDSSTLASRERDPTANGGVAPRYRPQTLTPTESGKLQLINSMCANPPLAPRLARGFFRRFFSVDVQVFGLFGSCDDDLFWIVSIHNHFLG